MAEKKGGKKGKDGPKRALSAYMFFSQDWRERIKSENPDAGFGKHRRGPCATTAALTLCRRGRQTAGCKVEGTRRLGEEGARSRRLITTNRHSSASLQPYIEQAAQDKLRADREKADFEVRLRSRLTSLLPLC